MYKTDTGEKVKALKAVDRELAIDERYGPGDQDLTSRNGRRIPMCEVLELKDQKQALPYDLEEPEDITKSLLSLFREIST
jgi:hypothetical protein